MCYPKTCFQFITKLPNTLKLYSLTENDAVKRWSFERKALTLEGVTAKARSKAAAGSSSLMSADGYNRQSQQVLAGACWSTIAAHLQETDVRKELLVQQS